MAAKKKASANKKKAAPKKRGRPRIPRMKPPPKERVVLTTAKKAKAIAFLLVFDNYMSYIGAAKAAGVTYQCLWENRRKDEEFDRQIKVAEEAFVQRIREIYYDRTINGMPGGINATKYSDKLLLVLLRRYDPSFHETTNINQKTEHSGSLKLPDLKSLGPRSRRRRPCWRMTRSEAARGR